MPLKLVPPERQLQAERDRFGVYAVGASHLIRILILKRLLLEHRGELIEIALDQGRCAFNLQRLSGIDDIVRGQPVMEPARGIGGVVALHGFGDRGGERNHVMSHFALDVLDAAKLETGMGAEVGRRFGRNFAKRSQGFGSG